MKAVLFLEVIE